VTQNENKAIR